MPNDLRQRFEQLRREPLGVVLPGPEALRRAGTHRRRSRRVVAAGLAAVAVVAVALNAVLPTPQGLTPPAATRTGAGETPSPTNSPAPTPTATSRPGAVPDAAFPTHSVVQFGQDGMDSGIRTLLPRLCGLIATEVDGVRELAETDDLLANRWETSYIDVPDPTAGPGPEGVIDVQILVFADDGAARLMESLRAAVATCRTDRDAMWGPYTFAAVFDGTPVYGDDTFTFIASHEQQDHPSVAPYMCEKLYEVVRVGEAVMVADLRGWETCHPEPELDRELRDKAIDSFVDWAVTV